MLNLKSLPTCPDITCELLHHHIGKAQVILEIGAADGRDTLKLLQRFPQAHIYCFEPEPRCLRMWRANVQDPRATMHCTAIGNHVGTIPWFASHGHLPDSQRATTEDPRDLWDDWPLSGSIKRPEAHLDIHPWVEFEQKFEVPITTLDEWLHDHRELSKIDLIWMDVQGAERDVIAGGQRTFKRTLWCSTEVFDEFFHPAELRGRHVYEGQPNIAEILGMLPKWRAVMYAHSQNVLLKNARVAYDPVETRRLTRPTVWPAWVDHGLSPTPVVLVPRSPDPRPPRTVLTPEPPTPPAPPPRPIITMERLGTFGQWGHQVVQYAFLRRYAAEHDLDYAPAPWAGRYLYGHHDQTPPRHMPPVIESVREGQNELWGQRLPPRGDELTDHDFVGWAQYDTTYYRPYRDLVQSLYRQPAEPQRSRVTAALEELRQYGDHVIALHLRRGDSGQGIHFRTPIGWCLRWLHDNWGRFHNPVLYLATEDVGLLRHFAGYNPVVAENLGIEHIPAPYPDYRPIFEITQARARQVDFFPDWYLVQHADVVLASNSMFSMSAAWTSTTAREVWRPRLSLGGFEPVDPWDLQDFLCREPLDHHPGIPGTQSEDHPGDGWATSSPIPVPEHDSELVPWRYPE